MNLSILTSEATQTLILLAKHKNLYSDKNTYSAFFENRSINGVQAIYLKLSVLYESGNEKTIPLGPFYTTESATGHLKSLMRAMVDHSNTDIHNSSRRILMYPAWLL